MQNTTAFELIKTLNSEQQRAFRIWLESPFFNTQKEVVLLYDFLLKSMEVKTKPKLKKYFEKATVWKVIYPKEVYLENDKNQATRLRVLLFKISENIKKYLIFNGLEEKTSMQYQLLHQQLIRAKLNDLATKNLQDWALFLEKKNKNQSSFWQEKALFLSAKIDFEIANKNDTSLIPEWCDAEILNQSNALLMLYNELLFDKKTVFDTAFLDDFVAIFEKSTFEKPIALQLQLLSIKMSKAQDNELIYKELKQLFQANDDKIDRKTSNKLVLSLSNVATNLSNKGDDFFTKEAFFWSLEKIKRQHNFEDGYMTTTTFKNTLRLGCNLLWHKKIKLDNWTPKRFIAESELLLHPDYRETYQSFALGFLAFHQEKHEEALPKMKAFKPNVAVHQLDAMRIILAIHYQLQDDGAFENQKSKIQAFLNENILFSANIRVFNENFIFFLEEIKKLGDDKKVKKALFQKIKNEKNVADKEWLLGL